MKRGDEQAKRISLLTTEEVAARLRISLGTLYNNLSSGQVPRGAKIPGLGLRWREDEFEDWLAKRFDEYRA